MVISERRRHAAGRAGATDSRHVFDMAAMASQRFDLTDGAVWQSDFMLGFLVRHALWGMNIAQHNAAWWDKVDIRNLEEALPIAAEIVSISAPSRFPVDRDEISNLLAGLVAAHDHQNPDSRAFGRGIRVGDRLLVGALAQSFSEDAVGASIHQAFRQYNELPGRRPRTLHYIFRRYKWTYAYAVAATVGRTAFGKTFSDIEAARRLDFIL